MDRPIKTGEFAISLLGFLGAIAMMVYNRGNAEGKFIERQINMEANYQQLKNEFKEYKENSTREKQQLSDRIDKLIEQNNSILIQLQNKQNRQ